MAKVLATDECTRKLFRLIQRYDIDELLVAATRRTPQGWPVISNDEKRGIEKLGGSRKQKLDRLITLVAKSAERMTRFAVFIKWYTSSIEEAADDVLGYQDSPGAVATQSMKKPETVTNSRVLKDAYEKTLVAEQRSHQKSFTDSLSSAARRATVHDRFVDTGLTANSQEQYPMETPGHLCSQFQIDDMSSASQRSSDVGYSSGLSKDFQSPVNLSAGAAGECTSLSTLQSSLKVVKRNHQSRQLKEQRGCLDHDTKHQHNHVHMHQPTVVVNHNYHYHFPGKDERQIESHEEWPSLLARHSREIIGSLNMEMLVPHLMEKGLLTRSEYCELDSNPSWKRSEHYVLKILPTKGEQGLKRFVECLKDESEHSGHQDLFESLKSKFK